MVIDISDDTHGNATNGRKVRGELFKRFLSNKAQTQIIFVLCQMKVRDANYLVYYILNCEVLYFIL
jgi:hypothetical protein